MAILVFMAVGCTERDTPLTPSSDAAVLIDASIGDAESSDFFGRDMQASPVGGGIEDASEMMESDVSQAGQATLSMGGQSAGGAPIGGRDDGPSGGQTTPSTPLTGGMPSDHAFECDARHPEHSVGLKSCVSGTAGGLTLFHPTGALTTYLIDELGRVVHTWPSEFRPGMHVELLDDGRLIRSQNLGPMPIQAGGAGGGIEIVDWDGQRLWQFRYSDDTHRTHHDFKVLPNGHILMISWVVHSRDDALAKGKDSARLSNSGEIWSDEIIELRPMGQNQAEVVWRWRAWDHLIQDFDENLPNFGVISEHPRRIDINTSGNKEDWLHINSVDYHAEMDVILLSVHGLSEIWVIDHSTTTQEAAGQVGGRYGRGGDLLYRWGNPSAYGVDEPQKLFAQHDAHWIAGDLPGSGNVLIFNNGLQMSTRDYSTVDELVLPQLDDLEFPGAGAPALAPQRARWTYKDPPTFFSRNVSSAQRLDNGNTFICQGASGRMFEVKPNGEIVWEYINPVVGGIPMPQGTPVDMDRPRNGVFRARRYPKSHPAFINRDLSGLSPIEGQ